MPDVSLILAALLLANVAPVGSATALAAEAPAPAIPDTPAGRRLASWIEAFNGGDPAVMAAWLGEHYPTSNVPPGALQGLREMTGGFDLVRIESAEEGRIVACSASATGKGPSPG